MLNDSILQLNTDCTHVTVEKYLFIYIISYGQKLAYLEDSSKSIKAKRMTLTLTSRDSFTSIQY